MNFEIKDSTIVLLRELEGVRYKAYRDSAGKLTIGVGHLILPREQYYLTATLNDSEINLLLRKDLQEALNSVNKYVHVSLSQNQVDALIGFTFNLGGKSLETSTLLKNINSGLQVLEHNFTDWDKEHKDGKLIEVEGLKNRREKEFSLFTQSIKQAA